MRFVLVLLIGALFAGRSYAETPCDFKGLSVGDRLSAPQVMTALGVSKYKIDPKLPFDMKLMDRYGLIPAGEIEDWNIGPYCTDTYCRVPYGITVGNNGTPVSVFLSLHNDLLTEIDISFSKTYWDDILPIINQKYGADWKVDRDITVITDFETKKSTQLELISLEHITNGTNPKTKDRCQLFAQNIDIVFQHHDAYGPYHSSFVIKLISKNF